MTERTVEEVNKEIRELEAEFRNASVVVGDNWNPGVVKFQIEEVYDPNDMPFPEWDEEFKKYNSGESIGDVNVVVHASNGSVEMSSEDFARITVAKMTLTGLLIVLAELRKERKQLQEIADKEAELNKMKEEIK